MSDDLHRAVEELIDAALVRDADPHRHRVAVKWMEAEEKVDRLARALARVDHNQYCQHGCFVDQSAYSPDCMYMWASDHIREVGP